jgi:hypothetical protein
MLRGRRSRCGPSTGLVLRLRSDSVSPPAQHPQAGTATCRRVAFAWGWLCHGEPCGLAAGWQCGVWCGLGQAEVGVTRVCGLGLVMCGYL